MSLPEGFLDGVDVIFLLIYAILYLVNSFNKFPRLVYDINYSMHKTLLLLATFFLDFLNGSEHVMSFKCALIISLVLGNIIFIFYNNDAEEYVRKCLL